MLDRLKNALKKSGTIALIGWDLARRLVAQCPGTFLVLWLLSFIAGVWL